ncbi:DNA-binding MarR family transcriptional regulator [Solirubrobacter pauli]|uniref:DNA-binding MarR family transcriptional regulator n=1 Tax=Solirubrobacter pauli TaxID=166793 RepID=A0A660LG70_9ACTN|nr:MarR family transcriptional regulator [Solirubrobacter pauli]RKQ92823.1 DNA-binding MarR family transcriptional regulator [Solirubrobacter pauli]
MSEPAPELVDAVAELAFAVHARLTALAARHDLSLTQMRLLGILRDREPPMLELGRHLDLTKSSVSGLVDRAARRGLVERVPGASDGRVVHVRLTDEGRTFARAVEQEAAKALSELLEPLPEPDRARLAQLAVRVTRGAT